MTSYKIVPLPNLNKYLHYDTSAPEMNISVNNISKKKHCDFSKLIIAVYPSVIYVYISCTCLTSRLEYNSLFVGLGSWNVRGSE